MMNNEELRCFLFASIISADNDDIEESIKQKIIHRYDKHPGNWEFILEPLGEDAEKYIKLFKEL